jgi:nucleotide-binding universal stress UspA family protein
MFRDIVVPLDGSGFAERALGLAGWIATESKARLHLVRARQESPDGLPGARHAAPRVEEHYLQSVAARLHDSVDNLSTGVLVGSAWLAIVDYADRAGADLIVMTTHGRTGDDRRRLGSVAAVVVHHARCPVLLVRGDDAKAGTRIPFEHILAVVNGAHRELVEATAMRLGTLQADVVVRDTEHAAETIVDAADAEDADLIVLAQSDTASLPFPPGLPERILRDWSSPVLLMRE